MKREKIFLGVFATAIAAVQGAFWLLPHEKLSEKEKRVLRQPPQLSPARLADGRFMEQAEAYLVDHFPGRDALIGANAALRQAEGLNAVGDITRGRDDWLIAAPLVDERKIFDQNLAALQSFLERTDKPASVMIVPTTGAVETAMLPRLHLPYPDEELLAAAQKSLAARAGWCDVLGTFRAQPAPERLFYRTDHHWTTEGAYEAYGLWCRETGREPTPKTAYTRTEVPGFYGTSYAKSGLWATPPDTLEVWETGMSVTVTVQDDNMKELKKQESLFFWEHKEEVDKYPIFLDGNHGHVTIETGNKGGRLLVLRDSFAHCLSPFLTAHFSRIDLIDLRYFKKQTASAYVEENLPDEILFCYGLDSLMTDRSLAQLR